jgi:chemotaxis protein methyltransferase CheR
MYFSPETARGVVGRISQALLPRGYLFLGHAETLRGITPAFHLCHTHDTFYYQQRDALDIDPAPIDSPSEVSRLLPKQLAPLATHTPSVSQTSTATPTRAWDLSLVLEAVRQERFADALALIGSLPADAHEDPDALLLRAVLLTNHGRTQESEEVCRRLLALDELNAGAHYLMALCREHDGDTNRAIEHGLTAIYLDPGFAMPHLHLGILAKRSGETISAQRELGKALVLLGSEDASRILLFGGGFSRDALVQLCRTQLSAVGGAA